MAAPRKSRRIFEIAISCVALAGLVIGVGSVRTRTDEATGTMLPGWVPASPPDPQRVRFGSMNIHGCTSPDGKDSLALTAEAIKNLDFVGLQEVRDTVWPGTPPQVQSLAKLLGKDWLYAPTERQYFSERFGNGFVTSLPAMLWRRTNLPSGQEDSRRNVAMLVASVGNRAVTLFVTHIARHEDQRAQLDYVAKLFLSAEEPAILMGDLNATSENPQIAEMLGTAGVKNPLDEKVPDKRGKHIDWILVRGMDVRDAGYRDVGSSDHPLVWTELALPVRE